MGEATKSVTLKGESTLKSRVLRRASEILLIKVCMFTTTNPSYAAATFLLERNQKGIPRLPIPNLQPKKALPQETLTKSMIVWFRDVPEQLQQLVHQSSFPPDKSVQGLSSPDRPVISGIGMLICLMEDGSCAKGIASMVAENMLLTSSQLLRKEGTKPAKVFFATEDKHSAGTIVEADGWNVGPDLLIDEATAFGLAIVHCRLLRKGFVFGINATTSSERIDPVVGYKLVLWTSVECPR